MHREAGKLKIFGIEEADDLVRELRNLLSTYRSFLLACVGTELRSDDRAGLEVCRELSKMGFSNVAECPHGLENCLHVLEEKKPELLIIIDAALIDEPCDYVLAEPSEVANQIPLSTHSVPLNLVLNLVESIANVRKVVVLGIKVRSLGIGLEMSEEVAERVRILAKLLAQTLPRRG